MLLEGDWGWGSSRQPREHGAWWGTHKKSLLLSQQDEMFGSGLGKESHLAEG